MQIFIRAKKLTNNQFSIYIGISRHLFLVGITRKPNNQLLNKNRQIITADQLNHRVFSQYYNYLLFILSIYFIYKIRVLKNLALKLCHLAVTTYLKHITKKERSVYYSNKIIISTIKPVYGTYHTFATFTREYLYIFRIC